MVFSRMKMVSLLRGSAILLCRLLLVDVACSWVCDWLLYLFLDIPNLDAESSKSSIYYAKDGNDGIQVILCGISRSGSMSLMHAMNILGFPCFHGAHIVNPTICKLFTKAKMSGSHHDWQNLLHKYRAIADMPAASSYKDLLKVYPKAKVILNIRDPEKWYQSFSRTFLDLHKSFEYQLFQPRVHRCMVKFLYQQILKGCEEDKDQSIQNYKLHIEEVKKHVPPHQLFVLELESLNGWEQMCQFLDVPTPNVAFPSMNNSEFFQSHVTTKVAFVLRTTIISYLALIIFVISQYSVYFSFKK